MSKRKPIVFIHGNGDSAMGWTSQIKRFKSKGYCEDELHAITMSPPQNESHKHYADQVKPFIDDVLKKTGASRVNLVAHSLGCTVSRYYIKFMGGAEIVERAVLISGGNHGLPAADLTMNNPGEFKQSPEVNTMGTQFLIDLNTGNNGDRETFGPTKYMTISGPNDEFFLFYEASPQLNGADNRVIPGYGHFGLRDCRGSFDCTSAFFEDRAEELGLGRRPLENQPKVPLGSWEIVGGPKKGFSVSFREDGTYEASEGASASKGKFRVDNSVSPNSLTLEQAEGPGGQGLRSGIYRMSVNREFLRLDVGEVGEKGPDQLAFAPTYELRYTAEPVPEGFPGTWKITDLGFCAAAGWTEGKIIFTRSGEFTITGGNIISPTGRFEISGTYSLTTMPANSRLTMEITNTDGNIPFFVVGEVMPAIFWWEGKRIWARWGSATFGIPRPTCMDSPVLLEKQGQVIT